MTHVNEDVRAKVKAVMQEKGLTQKQVADALGVDRVYINRMLSGNASQVPGRWADLLQELGLELTVKPKDGGS